MLEISLPVVIYIIFTPLLVFAYILYLNVQKSASDLAIGSSSREFSSFQRNYFIPYFMALFADWLQGPYVYKLYSYYGFEQREISILYIVGFASSVTFGTATGPLADKFGRRRMSLVFCGLYSFCCLTKLSPDFCMLLIGRILGGIATSIFFSVFESWYIHQHTIVRKYPLNWISLTFSKSTFFNGVFAIIAGVAAEAGVEWMHFGPVAPFIFAIPCLVLSGLWIYRCWDENYGEQQLNWHGSCMEGLYTIMRNRNILALGTAQSLFEGVMYIFVFLWTPVLEPGDPPLGFTFSSFMIAVMIGSSLYSYLLSRGVTSEHILKYCMMLMACSMFICTFCAKASATQDTVVIAYLSFLLLELSVGLYFPCIGRLRGETIPDNLRANIMNWFRVPLNIITCGGLLGMNYFDKNADQVVFLLCGIAALIGYFVAGTFARMPKKPSSDGEKAEITV